MEVTCVQCGIQFEGKNQGRMYCSGKCRMAAFNAAHPREKSVFKKECPHCKKWFTTNQATKVYCSRDCLWTTRNALRETSKLEYRECVVCKTKFQPMQKKGVGRKWCSEDCRKCHANKLAVSRKNHLKSHYGITVEDYNRMLVEQNGLCAICKQPETRGNGFTIGAKALAVDHCHVGGHVRGLLCNGCNVGLGSFKDDPERLVKAIEYLKKWQ